MNVNHRAALFHYPFSVFILRGFSKEKPRKIFFAGETKFR